MSLPRPDRRRTPRAARSLVVLVVALVATACASEDPPGVSVEAIQSDLVFGVEANTPVANFDPAPVSDPNSVSSNRELPSQIFEPVARTTRVTFAPTPPKRIEEECPTAPINEFPDEGAGFWRPEDRKEPPREGLYRWKRSGTVQNSNDEVSFTLPVSGFERRAIRNVNVISNEENGAGGNDITFTYEVVQPEVGTDNTVITTYRMRSNGRSNTVFSPVDDTQVRTGEPDRGLQIAKIEVVDPQGNSEVFEPSTPLLIFPIEVVIGDTFSASSVDPRTRDNVQIEAEVKARERVDACGDLVEGWEVHSTLTRSSGGDEVVRNFDFMVAPQYGGVIISEHTYEPGDDPAKRAHTDGHAGPDDILIQLAQQDPDPLPTGGQQ